MIAGFRCRFGHRHAVAMVVAIMSAVLGGTTALAGVLDRIAEDGVIRAGTRASAAPFAQKTATGEFVGLSVNLSESPDRRLVVHGQGVSPWMPQQ